MRAWTRLLCTSAVLLALVQPSHADGGDVAAYREAIARGAEHFEAQEWAEARAAFLEAYEIHPAPVLLFNIASTYRREGDLDRALEYYRKFVAVAADDDPQLALALQTIDAIERRIDAERERDEAEPPRAVPRVEQRAPEAAAVDAPPSRRSPALDLTESPVDRGDRVDTSWTTRHWLGAGAMALGGIGLGVAGYDLWRARSASRELAALPAGAAWNDEQADLYERGQRADERGTVLAITGGALLVGGAWLYVTAEPRSSERVRRRAVSIAPVGTSGAVFVFGGDL